MRITHLNAIYFPLVEQIYNIFYCFNDLQDDFPSRFKIYQREGLTVRWVTQASFILEVRLRKRNATCFLWNPFLGF